MSYASFVIHYVMAYGATLCYRLPKVKERECWVGTFPPNNKAGTPLESFRCPQIILTMTNTLKKLNSRRVKPSGQKKYSARRSAVQVSGWLRESKELILASANDS